MLSSAGTALENFVTDTWVKASWDEFLMLGDNPDYENGIFYYQGLLQTFSQGCSEAIAYLPSAL